MIIPVDFDKRITVTVSDQNSFGAHRVFVTVVGKISLGTDLKSLCKIISLQIFIQQMNFLHEALSTPHEHEGRSKRKTSEGGIFDRQNGCQKNRFYECFDICFLNI